VFARIRRPLRGLFTGLLLLVTSCSSEGDGAPTPESLTPESPTFHAGDPCTRDGELRCATEADGKKNGSVLWCANGVYEKVFACPGLQECNDYQTNTAVGCGPETSVIPYAKEGAPCGAEGAAACGFDRKTVQWCVGGTWVLAQHCPPTECTVSRAEGRNVVACSNGGATPGDLCKSDIAGAVMCSTDLKSILGCRNGRAVVVEECLPPRECSVVHTGGMPTIACM